MDYPCRVRRTHFSLRTFLRKLLRILPPTIKNNWTLRYFPAVSRIAAVRYADITYVINRIRSRLTESDVSIEDEYQIDQLENLVYFPIQYYNSNRTKNTKRKLHAN
jgi:hypothetical protein